MKSALAILVMCLMSAGVLFAYTESRSAVLAAFGLGCLFGAVAAGVLLYEFHEMGRTDDLED